jgi:type II secretory pathway component PulC
MQVGDLLREINAVDIDTPRDAERVINSAEQGLSVVVERGGQLLLLRFRI